MTVQMRREQETFQFKNRLNINKPYFRAFVNKFDGIAEAESVDEVSQGLPSVKADDYNSEEEGEETKEKPLMTRKTTKDMGESAEEIDDDQDDENKEDS